MKSLHEVRNRLVHDEGSVAERRRSRRWEWFMETFPEVESMSVIDVGGTVEAWGRAPIRPGSLHVVNLEPETADVPAWVNVDQADACNLPSRISEGRYDLVYSNSVIEHVGGYLQKQRFADAIHKLADRHWVQTPYRYFPIELHWIFPGFQFLPLSARARISQHWPLGHTPARSFKEGIEQALGIELLSQTEMAFYFPHSVIRSERILGLAKSLIAIKES